ncbi:hypothetical protein JL108_08675 [Aeromicrobium sp. YIM 150415]|uniref:hypothetical protein n=1 Tax=Aeromicrobium sp. YIM 150415 TaxID=2803912 RepID=UPI0019649370|nr:hypothetical protein [Aeromicrobium sp. YIM 150415]MBM9463524.1 hypothetical protein [Aeromicrobium sp. YIM 150415]
MVVAGLLVMPSSTAAPVPGSEEWAPLPEFPSLPDVRAAGIRGQWIGSQTRGANYVERSQQWVATPTLDTAVFNEQSRPYGDLTCQATPIPGIYQITEWRAYLAFVNRDADANASIRYGETQPFTVRTVAFGSVPVEATVALEQPKRDDGVVETAYVTIDSAIYGPSNSSASEFCHTHAPFQTQPPRGNYPPGMPLPSNNYITAAGDGPAAQGEARVRVDSLTVDGVSLDLMGSCRSDLGALVLDIEDYYGWDPSIRPEEHPYYTTRMTTPYYNPGTGGRLFGTIDVGAFGDCRTVAGEDVSALLTATVSGPGNAIEVWNEGLGTSGSGFDTCPFAFNCDELFPAYPVPDEKPEGS